MTPLSALELAGAAVLAGAGALNALVGLAARRSRTTLLFAAFFLCLTVANLSSLLLIGWRDWLAPADVRWIRLAGVPACYMLGPLFLAYVAALLPPAPRWRLRAWCRHGLPFLAALIISLLDAAWPGFGRLPAGAALVAIAYHAWVVQGLVYFLGAAWCVQLAGAGSGAADVAAGRLVWLRVLTAVMAAVWLAAGIKRIAVGSFDMDGTLANAALVTLASAALFFLTWFGLRQQELAFAGAPANDGRPGGRYARSALGEEERARVAADLIRLMHDRHLHADPQLDLSALSRHSGWPPAYISQTLNLHLGQNFFEFVTGFRIAAALRCLADPAERRTILEIAMASGFGSKSTFNAAFRRSTGLTPSGFRRRRGAAADERTDPLA